MQVVNAFSILLTGIEGILALALPPIGEVIVIATAMCDAAITAGIAVLQDTFQGVYSPDAYAEIKCILDRWCAADGSITSTGCTAIKDEFTAWLPGPFDAADALIFQVLWNDFVDANGPNGLTRFGGLSNISSADCSTCPWCVHYDFTVGDGGFNAALVGQEHYVSGVGWQSIDVGGIPACYVEKNVSGHVTQVKVEYSVSDNFHDDTGAVRLYHTGSQVYALNGAEHNHNSVSHKLVVGPGISVDTDRILLSIQCYPGGSVTFEHLWLYGTGTPPSGEPTCG